MNNICFGNRLIYPVDPKLPPLILEEMLKQVNTLPTMPAVVGEDNRKEKAIRDCSVSNLPWFHWIAGIMHNIMISANNDYFKYDLDHFDKGIQITKYDPDGHYQWHRDCLDGKSRKLSISLVLNDGYTGGEIELESKPQAFLFDPRAGEAIVFPSWIPHRVRPVKTGHRVSLVAWMNGPDFK